MDKVTTLHRQGGKAILIVICTLASPGLPQPSGRSKQPALAGHLRRFGEAFIRPATGQRAADGT